MNRQDIDLLLLKYAFGCGFTGFLLGIISTILFLILAY